MAAISAVVSRLRERALSLSWLSQAGCGIDEVTVYVTGCGRARSMTGIRTEVSAYSRKGVAASATDHPAPACCPSVGAVNGTGPGVRPNLIGFLKPR